MPRHRVGLIVDTGGGRKQEALDAVPVAGLEHMGIDQNVIAADGSEIGSNIANAAHVGGEIVDLINSSARGQ